MRKDAIGSMRERISVVTPVESVDTYGQPVQTWAEEFIGIYAEVGYQRQGSNEELEAGKITSFTKTTFRIRSRAITEKMRIVYRSKEYQIDSITYVDPKRCYMLLETIEDDKILFSA